MLTDDAEEDDDQPLEPKLADEHDQLHVYATVPAESAFRGVFWKHFAKICTDDPSAAREEQFGELVARTNNAMAQSGYKPPPMTNTLRTVKISADSLTLVDLD